MTYETTTSNSAATQTLAQRLSQLLSGGEVIELIADLGGGKTTFVQGLAAGLGYEGPVTSPTFTLSNIYLLPNGRELHHYDLYRLTEGGIVGDELAEDLADPQIITVIEWGGVAKNILPADRLAITFETVSEDEREFTFVSSGPMSEKLVVGLAS